MDSYDSLPSIRVNGKDPLPWACDLDETMRSVGLGRADRLAAIGHLAAGLAHEMNTPLGSISGHAEESLEILDSVHGGRLSSSMTNELRGRLLAVIRQANRCSRIASRLLQFAQCGARQSVAGCEVREVIRDAVALLAPTAQELGVSVEQRVAASLPSAPAPAAELEQLVVNLVQNGLDACTRGKRITVDAEQRDGLIQLTVRDNGCGIPEEVLPRIFDPFFTTKPVGQGTGLGLSVCHGIVRSVGGSIEVESAPSQGTRVVVKMPVGSIAATPPLHESRTAHTESSSSSHSGDEP